MELNLSQFWFLTHVPDIWVLHFHVGFWNPVHILDFKVIFWGDLGKKFLINSTNTVSIQQLKTNWGPPRAFSFIQKGKFTYLLPHNYESFVGLKVYLTSYNVDSWYHVVKIFSTFLQCLRNSYSVLRIHPLLALDSEFTGHVLYLFFIFHRGMLDTNPFWGKGRNRYEMRK